MLNSRTSRRESSTNVYIFSIANGTPRWYGFCDLAPSFSPPALFVVHPLPLGVSSINRTALPQVFRLSSPPLCLFLRPSCSHSLSLSLPRFLGLANMSSSSSIFRSFPGSYLHLVIAHITQYSRIGVTTREYDERMSSLLVAVVLLCLQEDRATCATETKERIA